jgi:hypothetical protein
MDCKGKEIFRCLRPVTRDSGEKYDIQEKI